MRLPKPSPDVRFCFGLAALAAALYAPALGVFFSLDDFGFLLRAAGHAAWQQALHRPISTRLYFTAAWNLFGDRVQYYHLLQLVLHLACAGWIMKIGRRLGLSALGARAAALLFLATPVAFTSLHWISGVQELSMAFFALTAAWLALGEGRLSALGALPAFAAALLCKESAALLLPALALAMPMSRPRRLLLGLGGLGIAAAALLAGGAFAAKPPGDPYEAGFGLNLLWNLLTYFAWSSRPWDFFPDRIPQFQPGLALWGLVLPALAGIAFWIRREARGGIIRASLFFLILLSPVLPLLRHSYFYYLYLPLAPIWLLVGEGLARLAGRRRWIFIVLLSLFSLSSAWSGSQRRHAMMGGGLLLDPVMRYAKVAETAVETMRAAEMAPRGDLLILVPFVGDAQRLDKGLRPVAGGVKLRFLPVERALLGGKALRLFFPGVTSASFAYDVPEGDRWRRQFLWWTYGQGKLAPLGYGERGRHLLARLFYEKGAPLRAEEQLQALLASHPGDPNLLYDLATVTLKTDEPGRAEEILAILERKAAQENPPGSATRAWKDLAKLLTGGEQGKGGGESQ